MYHCRIAGVEYFVNFGDDGIDAAYAILWAVLLDRRVPKISSIRLLAECLSLGCNKPFRICKLSMGCSAGRNTTP